MNRKQITIKKKFKVFFKLNKSINQLKIKIKMME